MKKHRVNQQIGCGNVKTMDTYQTHAKSTRLHCKYGNNGLNTPEARNTCKWFWEHRNIWCRERTTKKIEMKWGTCFPFSDSMNKKQFSPRVFSYLSLYYIYTLTLREYFLRYIGTRRQTKIITNIVVGWFDVICGRQNCGGFECIFLLTCR